MIIYHSREALSARLAALLHAGQLGADPELPKAQALINPPEAYRFTGLWLAGRDAAGRPIYAVGHASRPEVVERVFAGLAALFAIDPASYRLVAVGPQRAWGELALSAFHQVGLSGVARPLERLLLARRWRPCREVVIRAGMA